VTSRGTADFWQTYYALPSEIRSAARDAYRKFAANPRTRDFNSNASNSIPVHGRSG
jgi:hypothetical protein